MREPLLLHEMIVVRACSRRMRRTPPACREARRHATTQLTPSVKPLGAPPGRATGAVLIVPYLCTVLADISAHLGHPEDGLQALAEAHTLVEQQEERYWEVEIARLRGVLLLRQTGTPQAEAETCFRQALDVARRQEAKSLELRAAMSLARLWQQQGKGAEARALLAPVYSWFTEGFDTADLQEAQALLDALA